MYKANNLENCLVIEHCANCSTHQTHTRHNEKQYKQYAANRNYLFCRLTLLKLPKPLVTSTEARLMCGRMQFPKSGLWKTVTASWSPATIPTMRATWWSQESEHSKSPTRVFLSSRNCLVRCGPMCPQSQKELAKCSKIIQMEGQSTSSDRPTKPLAFTLAKKLPNQSRKQTQQALNSINPKANWRPNPFKSRNPNL